MSIGALFSGSHYGSPLADVAQASMRPTFELQFSLLQNQVISRLNKEIEKANESTEKIDAFLVLEKARLERMSEGMNKFRVDVSRNHNLLADVNDAVEDLQKALTSAKAGDSTAFDTLLTQINSMSERLVTVDGTTTGIIYDDGVPAIKKQGLVRYTDGDGATQKATSYADFAVTVTDPDPDVAAAKSAEATADAAASAVSMAISRLLNAQTQTDLKIDTVISMDNKVGKKITEATLDIEAAKTASQAEKADAVAKLKDKYSQMLNALSIGFEGAAAQSEYFAKHLLAVQEVDRGSVMNLFT